TGITTPGHFSLSNTAPPILVVTTLSGENNPSGTTSLREAITIADTISAPVTITFDPSILTKPSGNVIDLQSALPDLIGNVTTELACALYVPVHRDSNAPDLSVFPRDKGPRAPISALTTSGRSAGQGGGTATYGILTVSGCPPSGNSASTAAGGVDAAGGG